MTDPEELHVLHAPTAPTLQDKMTGAYFASGSTHSVDSADRRIPSPSADPKRPDWQSGGKRPMHWPDDHLQPASAGKQFVLCICTGLSAGWLLLSLASGALAALTVFSPNWINKRLNEAFLTLNNLQLPFAVPPPAWSPSAWSPSPQEPPEPVLLSSLGPFGGCAGLRGWLTGWPAGCEPTTQRMLLFSERVQPLWYASEMCLLLGLSVFALALLLAALGACKQSLCRKSIFNITGAVQALGGLFYMLGMILFVAGLADPLAKTVCGTNAEPFWLGGCSLGSGMLLAGLANLLMFVCALLSLQADRSTASDRVQQEILDGQRCVCLC